MNQYTKGPEAPPCERRTGYASNGTFTLNHAKAEAWRLRWEAEFRRTRWIETRHGLMPAPGWEPKGFKR